jgi:ABC-type transport system involved in cytochrome c biogenesis permease subunit
MLWGKPIWGTYWTWDARLTSTLILWFIYGGYLLVRAFARPDADVARPRRSGRRLPRRSDHPPVIFAADAPTQPVA